MSVWLVCSFPDNYPAEVPPIIEIEIEKGLSKKQGEQLRDVAMACAAENVGSPVIYTGWKLH